MTQNGLPQFLSKGLLEAQNLIPALNLLSSDETHVGDRFYQLLTAVFGDDHVKSFQGDIFFYCADGGDRANFGTWHSLHQDYLIGLAQKLNGLPLPKGRLRMSRRMTHNVVGSLYSRIGVFDHELFLTGLRNGLAFEDGVVALSAEGAQLLPHNPGHRLRYKHPFNYRPGAQPERFLRMLRDAFQDDSDADQKIELLREFTGISLAGAATEYDKYIIMQGEGGNGKSTVIEAIAALFPPETVSRISPKDFQKEYYLAQLHNKLLNYVTELPESTVLSSDKFKAIISKDKITARDPYEKPFDFYPCAGNIFSCNKLPASQDPTDGFWRRIYVVEFNHKFGEYSDKRGELEKQLEAERADIVSWAVDGAINLLKRRMYVEPDSSAEQVEQWRQVTDSVALWLKECTLPCPVGEDFEADYVREIWTASADAYQHFKDWCGRKGYTANSAKTWATRLSAIGKVKKELRDGNYWSIRLR